MSNIVTLEQAKALKKMGFNQPAYKFYVDEEEEYVDAEEMDFNRTSWAYSAPSVSDALQWIRENKDIFCYVTAIYRREKHRYVGMFFKSSTPLVHTHIFDTYPEAETTLLDEILNYLENKEEEI